MLFHLFVDADQVAKEHPEAASKNAPGKDEEDPVVLSGVFHVGKARGLSKVSEAVASGTLTTELGSDDRFVFGCDRSHCQNTGF